MNGAPEAGQTNLVTLKYEQLLSNDPAVLTRIGEGFGQAGLGVVLISGVPGVSALRRQLLLLGDRFSELPEEVRAKYADPLGGLASVGWSHGIEVLENGQPDKNKGSFYANPLHDSVATDANLIRKFPSYTTPNVWPDKELPSLKTTFRELGQLIMDVGFLLARHCDEHVKRKLPNFQQGKLETILRSSPIPKGRLLHYYPVADSSKTTSWCSQHTDHGSLTGLVSALYTQNGKEVPNPDPSAGLYIRARDGKAIRVSIPESHIAYQMGEAMQVHSGGVLRATPHFVKTATGPAAEGVARNTLAIFMQPRWDEKMDVPRGADPEGVGIGQWRPNISFGEFSELTVRKYTMRGS